MLERVHETIVAMASPPGTGAVGIVRLSGPGALVMADQLIVLREGTAVAQVAGARRVRGALLLDEATRVPADVYVFRAPRSYTRQDLVEIHTIGNPVILETARRRAIGLGALPAEPGEFTARAFLHGAMPLSEAEAVASLIHARADVQLRAARLMKEGTLHVQVTAARDALGELLALVEADIDFAEEPIEFITPRELQARLSAVEGDLRRLMARSMAVERLDTLPRILLFGAPNAGKSSLMNRLSGTRRSICAAVAGTTRDILTAPIVLGRREAVLLDTAGVDETVDEVLSAARELTRAAAERVDLVCVVVDLTTRDDGLVLRALRELRVGRMVVAANKADLLDAAMWKGAVARLSAEGIGPVCVVSALTGKGIDALRAALDEALAVETTTGAEAVVLSQRQQGAIRTAGEALAQGAALAAGARETIDCADLLAFELREALDALGAVTGEVTTENLLGQVFKRFCIGK